MIYKHGKAASDIDIVRDGAIAFDKQIFDEYMARVGMAMLGIRQAVPGSAQKLSAEHMEKIQRRITEAAVECLHRANCSKAAVRRAAHGYYSGNIKPAQRRIWIAESIQEAVDNTTPEAHKRANILHRMSGNEAFIFLFLVDIALSNPASRDERGAAVVHTSLAELADIMHWQNDSTGRQKVLAILERLFTMNAVIGKRQGVDIEHVITRIGVRWRDGKQDGARLGIALTIPQELLKWDKQFFGVSLQFMYLMSGADLIAYMADGSIRWHARAGDDKLTPTGCELGRKLYIASLVLGIGKLKYTLRELLERLEYNGKITKHVKNNMRRAIIWLSERGVIDYKEYPALGNMPERYTITRGEQLQRIEQGTHPQLQDDEQTPEQARERLQVRRAEMSGRPLQFVNTIGDAIMKRGGGAVVVRRQSVAPQRHLPGAV